MAVAGLLAAGLKIRHDYAIVAACHPANSAACLNLSDWFHADWHLGNGIHVALLAAPALIALFAGPPVVARELENRTYRYAWTQGIGRTRWTAAKLTYLGSVLTIPALIVSQLFTWLFAPFLATQDLTVLSPAVFDTRGIAYAAWTLTAFCLGAFFGALIRRVLPAMGAALGAYLLLGGLTWLYLDLQLPGQHVLAQAGLRDQLARDALRAAGRRDRLAGPPPGCLKHSVPEVRGRLKHCVASSARLPAVPPALTAPAARQAPTVRRRWRCRSRRTPGRRAGGR